MPAGQLLSLQPFALPGLSSRATNYAAQCYIVDETPTLDVGYVTREQRHRYFLWNGSGSDTVLTAIAKPDPNAAEGLVWNRVPPVTVLARGSVAMVLTVLAEGPLEFSAGFGFVSGCDLDPVLIVAGTRAPQLAGDVGYILFPHNWEDGLEEVLQWKTDILIAHDRTEQRMQLRTTPRRSWSIRMLVSGAGRRKLETWWGMRKSRYLFVPIWRDVSELPSAATAGSTLIPLSMASDNYVAGMPVAVWSSWDQSDIRTITGVGAGYVSVDAPLSQDWPAGSMVGPCRYCLSLEQRTVNRFTEDVGDYRTTLLAASDGWEPAGASIATYLDLPVCPFVPSWESPEESFDNQWVRLDNDTGLIEFDVQSEEPVMARDAQFLVIGRERINTFLSFLKDRAGRLGPFWLAANDRGFELVVPATAGESVLVIEPIDYEFALVDSNARAHIELITTEGTVIRRRIMAVQTLPSGNEQLTLDAALPVDVSAGALNRCSWLELVRLNSDEITLHWLSWECVQVSLPIVVLP